MKTTLTTLLTAIGVSGLLLSAAAQPDNNAAATTDQSTQSAAGADANAAAPDTGAPPPDAAPAQPAQDQGAMNGQDATPAQTETAPAENRPITSTVIAPRGSAPEVIASAFAPPTHPIGTNQNDLDMNFNNAPLDIVLNYLSDAAGFIVAQQTRVNGYVTIKGSHITKNQAVNLLNSELNRNNYAAILDETDPRILTIVSKSDARTSRIPVLIGNNPTNIPNTDEIATWIIPIRFVEARQLVSDLSLFVSQQATVVANEAGNSIVITDTQANIRHLVKIIQAVDNSAESETEIRVFRLQHASPVDVANEISSIFPASNGSGSQSPFTFGGGRGGGGRGGRGGGGAGGFGGGRGGFGGGGANPFAALFGGGGANSDTQQRIQKATQVTAVADQRIQAVIVTAPKDLMNEIAGIMDDIDVASERDQNTYVVELKNGDPQQIALELQNQFGSSSSRTGTSSQQTSALQTRQTQAATTMSQTTSSSGLNSSSGGGGGGGRAGGGGF